MHHLKAKIPKIGSLRKR